jgi:hypothetical protein
LKSLFGDKFGNIPLEAVGLYSYVQGRVGVGLQQLMAGSRKWGLEHLDRNDLVSPSERASKATGIPMPEDSEMEVVERILA